MDLMNKYALRTCVLMGGLLNENQPGEVLAIDVTEQLQELGIQCLTSADGVVPILKERFGASNPNH